MLPVENLVDIRDGNKHLVALFVLALELLVRIIINICILATRVAVTSPANPTLTHTHTHV